MKSKNHWEKVYGTKAATEVSWFQEHAKLSLSLIRKASIPVSASIIDVGGGASTLVDDLQASGYERITVLDLSGAALNIAKERLGDTANRVHWMEGSILDVELPENAIDVWHDRAVFHFLTTVTEREAYVRQVLRAVRPGGLVIIATFAEDGPTKCSGLPVMRYSAEELNSVFGQSLQLLAHEKESHRTPGGVEQKFVFCCFKKMGSAGECS